MSVSTLRPEPACTTTRRRPVVAAAIVVLLAAILAQGSVHRTCPPAEGGPLTGPTTSGISRPVLRIASFNIHGCRNPQGEYHLDRTVQALCGFDLVGLNEVHGAWSWHQPDQAQILGGKLGMPSLFAPTTRRWWRDDFGNGLLCRPRVAHWRRVPLPGTRSKGHRNLIVAEVSLADGTLHLLVTHLDNIQDGPRQLEQVARMFLDLPEPAILMGDLNTKATDSQLARLLTTHGVRDLVSDASGDTPSDRIDWILGRGVRALRGGVLDTGASDHPLVWTEIEVSATPPFAAAGGPSDRALD